VLLADTQGVSEPKSKTPSYSTGRDDSLDEADVPAIVDVLARGGHWSHWGWGIEESHRKLMARVRAAARERGLAVLGAGWTDTPLVWYEAKAPGVDSLTGLADRFALDFALHRHEHTARLHLAVFDIVHMGDAARALGADAKRLVAAAGAAVGDLAGKDVFAASAVADEFVLLLPDITAAQATERAVMLAAELDQLPLPEPLAACYQGVHRTVVSRQAAEPVDALLSRARDKGSRQW